MSTNTGTFRIAELAIAGARSKEQGISTRYYHDIKNVSGSYVMSPLESALRQAGLLPEAELIVRGNILRGGDTWLEGEITQGRTRYSLGFDLHRFSSEDPRKLREYVSKQLSTVERCEHFTLHRRGQHMLAVNIEMNDFPLRIAVMNARGLQENYLNGLAHVNPDAPYLVGVVQRGPPFRASIGHYAAADLAEVFKAAFAGARK